MTPTLTIIMAAYNAGTSIGSPEIGELDAKQPERSGRSKIAAAIRSVLAQTYTDWELIVVNDCSKDNTLEIADSFAKSDPRIRVISNESNLGVSLTRKKALDAAKGEWIAVLDSDDIWDQYKLEKQFALAEKENADLVFTGSAFIDNDGNPINWQLHVPGTISYRELLKQDIISNSSVLVKKELYEQFYVIGDDISSDFAMWLKMAKSGCKIIGLDEPLLSYRLSTNSMTRNKMKAAFRTWKTYRHVGLNLFEAAYFMCWYTARGVKKYWNLKRLPAQKSFSINAYFI